MSTSLSFGPIPVPYPFPARTRTLQRPFFHRTHFPGLPDSRPLLRTVAKFGFLGSGHLPDPDTSEGVIKELVSRAEGILYTIADAAVSNSDVVSESKQTSGDWLSGITNSMESILKVLKNGLSALHVPYAYGFAIILLTVLVKAATFPLTKKQVESAMAMRSLQPQIKAIQQRYAGDQERIQLETARLYKLAGINPLAGCLPTLATIPVWIGLYRALSNVANEGLLKEGFFWIPSLAGPTTIASRQNGSGISWLFPFVDGHPPLGWSDTAAYLVLPVLLIVSQYISVQIMQSSQPNDPNMKTSQAITKFLPLMIGYFALSVPSGLSLYWFTNNILSTVQQVWLQKLGGAKNPMGQITDDIFKEKPLETPKSVFDTKSTETVEKSPSTGLQQGERFKQLKEEEARRKQKREEEMRRKAEEAADKATHTTKEGHEKQDSLVERGNGATAGVVNGRNEVNMPSTTPDFSSAGPAVNGNASTMASKEQQGTSDVSAESSEPTNGTSNEQLEQIRDENSEKGTVEVPDGRAASSENRSSGEETSS